MTQETEALPDVGSCTLDPSVPREPDVESHTTPSVLNPQPDDESCTPSVRPPDMDSESVPEAPPPTYSQARCHAVYGTTSPPADDGEPEENCLTIRWNPSGNNEPYLPPLPSAANPSATSSTAAPGQAEVRPQAEARHPESQVPKVPEFREAISKFERAHSDLQAYATAICDITKEMHGLKDTMFSIQEFWMDNGQQDLARGVLPILDMTAKALPTFAFPPRLNTAPLWITSCRIPVPFPLSAVLSRGRLFRLEVAARVLREIEASAMGDWSFVTAASASFPFFEVDFCLAVFTLVLDRRVLVSEAVANEGPGWLSCELLAVLALAASEICWGSKSI
ncbi:hypothetical protein NMY22_g15623 [Coprinellus aureogranulatus]|nr:hypothetical protein NMY22_g15623 [Coprinellus aureogranulatus]